MGGKPPSEPADQESEVHRDEAEPHRADEAEPETLATRPGARSRAARAARSARSATAAATSADQSPDRRMRRERERLRKARARMQREHDVTTGRTPTSARSGHWALVADSRLLVPMVVALVAALVVGLIVVGLHDRAERATAEVSASATAQASAQPLLSPAAMLTTDDAKRIDGSREWKVVLDQQGRDDSSPSAACVASNPPLGQPDPQQVLLRTLTADGPNSLAVLHQAQAYESREAATQAFTSITKGFGDCTLPAAYLSSGSTVSGVGDQVVALTFTVVGPTPQYRTVVVNRTGRVVSVVDVAQNAHAVAVRPVLAALGRVTDEQCGTSGGLCTGTITASAGPPPPGGDQPGFLALADLPPVGSQPGDATWTGLPPGEPNTTSTSGCEGVDFTTTPAVGRVARTYLWSATPAKSTFGLDEDVLTLKSASQAADLMKRVVGNLRDCHQRQLTAAVSDVHEIAGVGSHGSRVRGWTARVSQQSTDTTLQHRVAVLAVGPQVGYLFLPVDAGLDLTSSQWTALAVRAGQRISQAE